MNARMVAFERELAALIGKHADWLDGRTFVETALRCADGYFEDVPALVDVHMFADKLCEALREGT